MRIISGKNRGRIIKPPKKLTARPTTDFAREGLFNILENNFHFEEVVVLDLFAGTGSIGLEFGSRGCKSVQMVDNNRLHVKFIQKLIEELNYPYAEVFLEDAFVFIRNSIHKYHVIFADPPYSMAGSEEIPDLIFEYGLLKVDGWLVFEHSAKLNFSDHFHFFKHRKYGSVNFSFFNLNKIE